VLARYLNGYPCQPPAAECFRDARSREINERPLFPSRAYEYTGAILTFAVQYHSSGKSGPAAVSSCPFSSTPSPFPRPSLLLPELLENIKTSGRADEDEDSRDEGGSAEREGNIQRGREVARANSFVSLSGDRGEAGDGGGGEGEAAGDGQGGRGRRAVWNYEV